MIKKYTTKLRGGPPPVPPKLDRVTFAPTSLDLQPGQSGTVTATGLDQFGAPIGVTVASVSSAYPGLVLAKSGATFTVTAPATGPVADTDIQLDVDVQ